MNLWTTLDSISYQRARLKQSVKETWATDLSCSPIRRKEQFIDSKELHPALPKVKRPARIKKSPKGGELVSAKKVARRAGLFGFKTKRLFILFIALAIMGLLTIFSVQMSHAKVYLDNPTPLTEIPTEQARISPTIEFDKQKQVSLIKTERRLESPVVRHTATGGANTYDYHSCVWWAYERRMQLGNPVPNSWHSAYQWLGYARAQGWATGSVPRVGAVGTRNNHVIIVERISGSRIYLSERNYDYNGSYRERWAGASDFYYIY